MIRSILVGLDGSIYSDAATALGIRWAKQYGSRLVGIGIVDQPALFAKAGEGSVLLGEMTDSSVSASRHHVDNLIELFNLRCKDAGVEHEAIEEVCPPCEGILLEAQRHDVILMGQKTYFHGEKQPQGDHDTVAYIVRHNPRPVIAVPHEVNDGEAVVVAYDGSIQSARAIEALYTSELWRDRPVHIVSLDRNLDEAKRRAQIAADYLALHDISAECHAREPDGAIGDTILAEAKRLGADLLVMGAYGQPQLKEFFVGSVTKAVLKQAPMPVFLYH